ncbi:MAG: hypothetical protein JRD19_03715, partial [Deltaproteobacteria bacterium]|nr:hypothetical protein [Deltaproteobacteria bacterium]
MGLDIPFNTFSVKKSLAAGAISFNTATKGIVMQSLVKLYEIEASPPSLGDNTGDLDRLAQALSRHLQDLKTIVPYNR